MSGNGRKTSINTIEQTLNTTKLPVGRRRQHSHETLNQVPSSASSSLMMLIGQPANSNQVALALRAESFLFGPLTFSAKNKQRSVSSAARQPAAPVRTHRIAVQAKGRVSKNTSFLAKPSELSQGQATGERCCIHDLRLLFW